MKIVTIEQVRDHARADGDDDPQLELYATAAERMFERLAHRAIFVDSTQMAAAQANVEATVAAAWDAYELSHAAVMSLPAGERRDDMLARARASLRRVLDEQEAITHGMVASEDVQVAICILAAHLYRNREEVVAGQGAAAVQVPMAAERVAYMYRWVGPL